MFDQFNQKFDSNKELSCALILHDAGTKDERKDYVEEFKAGRIDLLFVFNMLLTGFDAPRLKKLYMGRVIREHNLLQALTRVNRPYKEFRYGYIVDFADIRKEFEVTNSSYSAELQSEIGNEMDNYSNLFLSRDEILATINQIKSDLFIYNLDNAEEFSKQIKNLLLGETDSGVAVPGLTLSKVLEAYTSQPLMTTGEEVPERPTKFVPSSEYA
jgi:type I restriction enzyme R subunit